MATQDSKLIIEFLEPFRNFLDESIKGKIANPPRHFDMIIDSVLISHFMRHCAVSDETFYYVVEHIYHKNIDSIKNIKMTYKEADITYPFYVDELMFESFIQDYKKLSVNVSFAKELIRSTIIGCMNEGNDIQQALKDYYAGKGKMKLAGAFFINCFIHPMHLVNKDHIAYTYHEGIVSFSSNVYPHFEKKVMDLINGLMKHYKL